MKRKLQENKKKGFTLVELIVVLVILAILAALLIPALTGYIDKARQKQVAAETRACVMAAQTLGDELYGKGTAPTDTNVTNADIEKLAEVKSGGVQNKTFDTKGHLTQLEYQNNGLTCTYSWNESAGGSYTDPS